MPGLVAAQPDVPSADPAQAQQPAIIPIHQLVRNLSKTVSQTQRLLGHDAPRADADAAGGALLANAPQPRRSVALNVAHLTAPDNRDPLYKASEDLGALGVVLRAAVTVGLGSHRFDVVRDSLHGHPVNPLMESPKRAFADPKNVLTALEQEYLEEAFDVDDVALDEVPEAFRRLNSPRHAKTRPTTATQMREEQMDRLPMAFAEHLEGHLTDMRTALDPEVWLDVQRKVDWSNWEEEEKRAALSKVVVPRRKDAILNAEDFEPQPRTLALGRAREAQKAAEEAKILEDRSKRRRSTATDLEVIANYRGITVKRAGQEMTEGHMDIQEAAMLVEKLRSAQHMEDPLLQNPDSLLAAMPPVNKEQVARYMAPSDWFWTDLDHQIEEGLRQAMAKPKMEELINATEDAVYLVSKRRHYARLASRIFGQHVAATRIQAHWRGYCVRKWYRAYRNTQEFEERQRVYEQQLKEHWAKEEEKQKELEAKAEEKRKEAEAKHQEKVANDINQWKARSRYMDSAATWAAKRIKAQAKEALDKVDRMALGNAHMKRALSSARISETSLSFRDEGSVRSQHSSHTMRGKDGRRPGSSTSSPDLPLPRYLQGERTNDSASMDINAAAESMAAEFAEGDGVPATMPQYLAEQAAVGGDRGFARSSDGARSVGRSSIGGGSVSGLSYGRSSIGNTSLTSKTSGAAFSTRSRARDGRSGWLKSHASSDDERQEKVIDESLATSRLKERRRARQERREAAKRMAAMRPEQRAAARSEEERIERRLAVMEDLLGPEAAERFREGVVKLGADGTRALKSAYAELVPENSEEPDSYKSIQIQLEPIKEAPSIAGELAETGLSRSASMEQFSGGGSVELSGTPKHMHRIAELGGGAGTETGASAMDVDDGSGDPVTSGSKAGKAEEEGAEEPMDVDAAQPRDSWIDGVMQLESQPLSQQHASEELANGGREPSACQQSQGVPAGVLMLASQQATGDGPWHGAVLQSKFTGQGSHNIADIAPQLTPSQEVLDFQDLSTPRRAAAGCGSGVGADVEGAPESMPTMLGSRRTVARVSRPVASSAVDAQQQAMSGWMRAEDASLPRREPQDADAGALDEDSHAELSFRPHDAPAPEASFGHMPDAAQERGMDDFERAYQAFQRESLPQIMSRNSSMDASEARDSHPRFGAPSADAASHLTDSVSMGLPAARGDGAATIRSNASARAHADPFGAQQSGVPQHGDGAGIGGWAFSPGAQAGAQADRQPSGGFRARHRRSSSVTDMPALTPHGSSGAHQGNPQAAHHAFTVQGAAGFASLTELLPDRADQQNGIQHLVSEEHENGYADGYYADDYANMHGSPTAGAGMMSSTLSLALPMDTLEPIDEEVTPMGGAMASPLPDPQQKSFWELSMRRRARTGHGDPADYAENGGHPNGRASGADSAIENNGAGVAEPGFGGPATRGSMGSDGATDEEQRENARPRTGPHFWEDGSEIQLMVKHEDASQDAGDGDALENGPALFNSGKLVREVSLKRPDDGSDGLAPAEHLRPHTPAGSTPIKHDQAANAALQGGFPGMSLAALEHYAEVRRVSHGPAARGGPVRKEREGPEALILKDVKRLTAEIGGHAGAGDEEAWGLGVWGTSGNACSSTDRNALRASLLAMAPSIGSEYAIAPDAPSAVAPRFRDRHTANTETVSPTSSYLPPLRRNSVSETPSRRSMSAVQELSASYPPPTVAGPTDGTRGVPAPQRPGPTGYALEERPSGGQDASGRTGPNLLPSIVNRRMLEQNLSLTRASWSGQFAQRLVPQVQSQTDVYEASKHLRQRHARRRSTVTDINDTISLLRAGHSLGVTLPNAKAGLGD